MAFFEMQWLYPFIDLYETLNSELKGIYELGVCACACACACACEGGNLDVT